MVRRETCKSIKLFRDTFKLVIKLAEFEIQISFLLPVTILLMYFFGMLADFVLVFISMFFHETGHIISALLMKFKVHSVVFLPVGLNAEIEVSNSVLWKKIILCLSGSFTNILILIPLAFIKYSYILNSKYAFSVFKSNIFLALFNIIPILPLDGGRLLSTVLAGKYGIYSSHTNTKRVSLVFSFILIALGVMQMAGNIYNFSILAIGIYIIFFLKSAKMEAALMNMKDIIYRKSRLLKRGIYPARELVVLKSVKIVDMLKSMDFDRFHIIYVLDDNLCLHKSYTEQQIMDLILEYGTNITFEELDGTERLIRGSAKPL